MRTTVRFLGSLLALWLAGAAFGARVEGNISLVAQSGGNLSSYSWAQYYDSLGFTHEFYIQGTHSIIGVDTLQWATYTGHYEGTRQGPWKCGHDYEARNYANVYPFGPGTTDNIPGGPWTASVSSPACLNPHPDPQPAPNPTEPYSPIIINTAGAYSLTGADDPVLFDIDADGRRNLIGWTAREGDDAFLVQDRNRNGEIDDGRELFGNAMRLRSGVTAANGFEALREFDDNGDSVIDSNDTVWSDLLLWRDSNHDGLSTPSELSSVNRSAIGGIQLTYHWTGRVDSHGNQFRYAAHVELNGRRERRTVYDVFFVSVR
jgi:hypothetical protein